jgi:hypothetical protein
MSRIESITSQHGIMIPDEVSRQQANTIFLQVEPHLGITITTAEGREWRPGQICWRTVVNLLKKRQR